LDSSASLFALWSAIACGSSLVVALLLLGAVIHLSFKRLQNDLSSLTQTLQSCVSLLHRIAGDSLTQGHLEKERGASQRAGTADRK